MTREEFIGKLRSIYVGEENAIDEIISEYDRLKEVIEKKNTFYDSLAVDYRLAQEGIDRLNNIINELEKYTRENIKVLENRLNSPFCNFEKVTKELSIFQNYLDKLKELKENNK